ncbi:cytochrome P450 [Streptomyces sp. NRRL B-1347]|uniref:cytochrome P450 n=1 Tax=Streptomyces sp. NRRL B-1347 TaxID=1476877 RepID=UPI0004C7D96E|nr:cytochrome P450 [Streptomyces sp. NRRL B-1347]
MTTLGPMPCADALLTDAEGPIWQRFAALPRHHRAVRLNDSVVLLEHADGRAVLTSRDYSQGILNDLQRAHIDPRYIARRRRSLLHLEEPAHSQHRRYAARSFKPAAVDRLRPLMRRTVARLLPATAQPVFDAVTQLTDRYPIPIISAALGLPDQDADFLSRTAHAWTHALFDPTAVPAGLAAHERLDAHVTRLFRGPPAPEGTLLADLRAPSHPLTPPERIALITAVLMAGIDTPRLQLASGLELLARHPQHWRTLRAHPERIPQAVDEIIRLTPAISLLRRTASVDTSLAGLPLRQGTRIILCIPAMNRAPGLYHQPGVFDIARNAGTGLSFGAGAHYCLGARLAHAMLEEAITVLTHRLATITPAAPPIWHPPLALQGPAHLPLACTREGAP